MARGACKGSRPHLRHRRHALRRLRPAARRRLAFLAALDRSVEVHYVTARPEASRAGTEAFLVGQRLPGWRNLHFCPTWQSSRQHKAEVMARLAREFDVVVSVGDHDEDEAASRAAGIPFVRVNGDNDEEAWREIAHLVGAAGTTNPQGDRA